MPKLLSFDCRLHRRIVHSALLEWALALAGLNFPPYVVEHIFNCLQQSCVVVDDDSGDYQHRTVDSSAISMGEDAIHTSNVSLPYAEVILSERSHYDNIQLFIAVHKAHRKCRAFKE